MPSDAKKREKKKKKEANKQRKKKSQIPDKSKLDKEKTDDKSSVTVDKTEETKGSGDSGDKAPQLYETASGAEGHELIYQRVPQINENRTGATIIEGKQDNSTVQIKTSMAKAKNSITEEMNQTEHKNWVKAGLCFYEAKDVLLDFVAGDRTEPKPDADCDISPILKCIIDSSKYQQQQFGGLQKSAKTVRHDRNNYIHERPHPKVTSKELNRFKSNISNLLKNQMLQKRGKTERAQRRIDEICKVEYIILPKDEHFSRLSNIEGKLDQIETTEKKKIPYLEEEIKDIRDVLEKFEGSGDNSELEAKFQKVEADLKEKISKLTIRVDKLECQVGELSKDKDKKKQETSTKRSETEGLRQLKNQTEDNLDTFRKMGFIPTSQTEKAKKLLQEKRSIVIKGNPGEGKSSTALHLIDNSNYTDQRVVISRPKQWEKVDTDRVKIVVLEDIFGQYDLDTGRLQEWINTYLKMIQKHVDEGKLLVIINVRDDIFTKASSMLKSCKLFDRDRTLTLCSGELKNTDKKSILDRELKRNNKDMNVHEKGQCIHNFEGLIGFPQCCFLFAGSEDLFGQGPDFFKSPEKFLVDNISNLTKDSFLSLAFLFCTKEIEEEYLSPLQKKESKNFVQILKELASHLNVPFNESTVISLRQSYVHYSGLYVKKVFSCQDHSGENLAHVPFSGGNFSKSFIQFSHATIYEAVGQVLGDKCPEMVAKYCDSEYLYQRTYTAEEKDNYSQNVFIPVSLYGLLVKRMVNDVVEKSIVKSVVNHSALKQIRFLMKLKDELLEDNKIKDFFMAKQFSGFIKKIPGDCITFLNYILQRDEVTVKLVYSQFMEFLTCTHNKNSSDCWQCEEKQNLLELALHYRHFEIADKLITMNACYTHESLCIASRHGDLSISRFKTIMEDLKKSQNFYREHVWAKQALCEAYLSSSQDVIEILLKEGITLDRIHVIDVVQQGNIHVLKKVVEHLKCHNMWYPSLELAVILPKLFCFIAFSDLFGKIRNYPFDSPCSTALHITCCNQKFDMADYLLKNGAKVTLEMLAFVTQDGSKEAVARLIQNLKVNCQWDPHCDDASKVLERAYQVQNYDVCDLLIEEGVSLTMKCIPRAILSSWDCVKTVVKLLKDTESWDPKCDDALKALAKAYGAQQYDVCDLLIQEGVFLTMKNFPYVVRRLQISLVAVTKAVQHLKDTHNWYPNCEDASKALEAAFEEMKYDVCDLLIQEGVSLTVKKLPSMFHRVGISLEVFKKAVQYLKDANNWEPNCEDTSEALKKAYEEKMYDVCELLIQEGVSLTMEHIPHAILRSLDYGKTVVKQLIDAGRWDPKCDHASEALAKAYGEQKYDVCDLLIQKGVSLTMKNLPHYFAIQRSLEIVKKVVQHLKDTKNWVPNCADASEILAAAYCINQYDVFDLLIQEGVLLTMKNLPHVLWEKKRLAGKKALQHLKDNNNWDPKCENASKALELAFIKQNYDVCNLLIQEGVSLTMKNLSHVVKDLRPSLEDVKKMVQHLKDTNNWDQNCEDVLTILETAWKKKMYDVCFMLHQEGLSVTM